MQEVIRVEQKDGVAVVSLNRPDRMNAINLAMWEALAQRFLQLSAETDITAIVLRGAGGQAFAPGADIGEFIERRADEEQARVYDAIMRQGLAAVAACPHPVIARIQGPCIGGGLELAALCDIRISGRSGRFGVPVGKISVVMGQPEIQALLALVGPARMSEILLEARIYDAHEALAMGLVNRVVEDEMLDDEIEATLKRIAGNAPLVNRWHKAFVKRLLDPAPLSLAEMDQAYDHLATADYAEGVRAFGEKRRPRFTGR